MDITGVTPSMGVPGGEVTLECRGFQPHLAERSSVWLGEVKAGIVSASEDRVVIRLPDSPNALGISLGAGASRSKLYPMTIASRLATDLHPVANPVILPDGCIVTTISGTRGQQVPQPLVRILPSGEKVPYACEIINPTGLALDVHGRLHISSRHDGTVLKLIEPDQLELVADDLGIACGIAFDSKGFLYVGDRGGRILRVDKEGRKEVFARLEPSISAYHLLFDERDRLYVACPTLSMRDSLLRISTNADVEAVMEGLARPQGMALLPDGDILIAASYAGRKGIFRFSPATRQIIHLIAAPTLVGCAVKGDAIILADSRSIFRIQPAWGSGRVV